MERRYLLQGAALFAFSAGLATAGDEASAPANAEADALRDDIGKYPRCVICNMDRRKFHHARHLLVYGDGLVQGTCSVHCAAECMLRERRRRFRAIYGADFGSPSDPKPLVEVSGASYLIGSDLRGVMTKVSKVAFAHMASAEAAREEHGGIIGSYSSAVSASLREVGEGVVRRYDYDRERLLRNAKAKG